MNTAQKKYYRQVKKNIPWKIKEKKELLKKLKYSLNTFSKSHTRTSYFDYIRNFGAPYEYAEVLLEDSDTYNLIHGLHSANRLIHMIFTGYFFILTFIIIILMKPKKRI